MDKNLYGKLKIMIGKKLYYLVTTLELSDPGKVKVSLVDYPNQDVANFPYPITISDIIPVMPHIF